MAPTGPVVTFQYGTGTKGKGVEGGARHLRQPRGLHLCRDGSLLVADFGNNCVLRFKPKDSTGKVVAGQEGKELPAVDPMKDIDKMGPMRLPDEEGFLLKHPCDVCEDPEGEGLLVLDTDEGSLQRFTGKGAAQTLVPLGGKTVGKSLGSPETVKAPRAAFVAPDGALIICDTWSHRVLRFGAPGSAEALAPPVVLAGTPNSCGAKADQLAFPSCACLRGDGALLVADTNNHRVQCFQPGETTGVTVAGSSAGTRGSGLAELDMPTGICIDTRDESLLVCDRANARVLRFPPQSAAGAEAEVVVSSDLVQRPWSICLAPGGAILVSDDRGARVLRLEVDGMPWVPPAAAAIASALSTGPAAEEPDTRGVTPVPPTSSVLEQQPSPPPMSPPKLSVLESRVPDVSGGCMDLD